MKKFNKKAEFNKILQMYKNSYHKNVDILTFARNYYSNYILGLTRLRDFWYSDEARNRVKNLAENQNEKRVVKKKVIVIKKKSS